MRALGMIEVIGLPPAIVAADAALKAARVELLAIAKADAGILTVEIIGDVSAVTAAVEAGAVAAERVGILRGKHIIARVDESLLGKMIIQGTKLFQPKKKTMNQTATVESTTDLDQKKEEFIGSIADHRTAANEVKIEANMQNRTEDKTESIEVILNNRTEDKEERIEAKAEDRTEDKEERVKAKAEDRTEDKEERVKAKAEDRTEDNEESAEVKVEDRTKDNEESVEAKVEDRTKVNDDKNKTVETKYTAAELKKKSNDTLRSILQSRGVELNEQLRSAKKQELIQLILMTQNHR